MDILHHRPLFHFSALHKRFSFFSESFLSLFYPRICQACGRMLFLQEKVVCLPCERHLPETDFTGWPGNPVEKVFWGRAKITGATSLYFFAKGEKIQKLMHALKYRGRKDIGIWLGKKLGIELLNSNRFRKIDYIVPVPLHPKKEYKRGYNQSEMIARGISDITGWPVSALLQRLTNTATQTRKGKYERWKNVSGKFAVKNGVSVSGKSILLIDDIITTGATLEANIHTLLGSGARDVFIATVAIA